MWSQNDRYFTVSLVKNVYIEVRGLRVNDNILLSTTNVRRLPRDNIRDPDIFYNLLFSSTVVPFTEVITSGISLFIGQRRSFGSLQIDKPVKSLSLITFD